MKLDPGIHIAMHSVLSLKPGVTITKCCGDAYAALDLWAYKDGSSSE